MHATIKPLQISFLSQPASLKIYDYECTVREKKKESTIMSTQKSSHLVASTNTLSKANAEEKKCNDEEKCNGTEKDATEGTNCFSYGAPPSEESQKVIEDERECNTEDVGIGESQRGSVAEGENSPDFSNNQRTNNLVFIKKEDCQAEEISITPGEEKEEKCNIEKLCSKETRDKHSKPDISQDDSSSSIGKDPKCIVEGKTLVGDREEEKKNYSKDDADTETNVLEVTPPPNEHPSEKIEKRTRKPTKSYCKAVEGNETVRIGDESLSLRCQGKLDGSKDIPNLKIELDGNSSNKEMTQHEKKEEEMRDDLIKDLTGEADGECVGEDSTLRDSKGSFFVKCTDPPINDSHSKDQLPVGVIDQLVEKSTPPHETLTKEPQLDRADLSPKEASESSEDLRSSSSVNERVVIKEITDSSAVKADGIQGSPGVGPLSELSRSKDSEKNVKESRVNPLKILVRKRKFNGEEFPVCDACESFTKVDSPQDENEQKIEDGDCAKSDDCKSKTNDSLPVDSERNIKYSEPHANKTDGEFYKVEDRIRGPSSETSSVSHKVASVDAIRKNDRENTAIICSGDDRRVGCKSQFEGEEKNGKDIPSNQIGNRWVSSKGSPKKPNESQTPAVTILLDENNSSNTEFPSNNEPHKSTLENTQSSVTDSICHRGRTRSLSSALSSLSGEGDAMENEDYFDNDGKTPLRANRSFKRSSNSPGAYRSQGPVRKRHKGRALFSDPDSTSNSEKRTFAATTSYGNESHTVNDSSVNGNQTSELHDVLSEKPTTDNDIIFDGLEQRGRSRSNTVESFRAAMEFQLSDFPDESIVLPEMKGDEAEFANLEELGRPRSDTLEFLKKSISLSGDRDRSDSIDFLSSAIGFELPSTPNRAGLLGAESHHNASEGCQKDDGSHSGKFRVNNTAVCFPDEQIQASSHQDNAVASHAGESSILNAACGGSAEKLMTGKTPKKSNLSGELVASHGPLRKRYKTRSLSFASKEQETVGFKPSADFNGSKNEKKTQESKNEDDIETVVSESPAGGRVRSNTLESFHNAFLGRSRSDTMDFLTAAVAGDVGHNLDAASAAAVADGSSFSTHPISAPSGASLNFSTSLPRRSRSDTIDSTASSINSAKLDFLVSVAVEEGVLASPLPEDNRGRAESTSENSADCIQRRPRSDTLDIYANMHSNRVRSNTVDFMIGADDEEIIGAIDEVDTLGDKSETKSSSGCVLEHLKALCEEPKITECKSTGILRRKRRSNSDNADIASPPVSSPRASLSEESPITKRVRTSSEHTKTNLSIDWSSHRLRSDSINSQSEGRNRLESWGGMSDLSFSGVDPTAMSALKSLGDDIMAAAADIDDDEMVDNLDDHANDDHNQSKSSEKARNNDGIAAATKCRPRQDSLASLSLASLSEASVSVSGYSKNDTSASESKTKTMIKSKNAPAKEATDAKKDSPKTLAPVPTNTPSIIVDYDAIAAAVHAANAATEGLDLNSILNTQTPPSTVAAALASGWNQSKPTVGGELNGNKKKVKGPAKKMKSQLPPASNRSSIANKPLAKSSVPGLVGSSTITPIPVKSTTPSEKNAIKQTSPASLGTIPLSSESILSTNLPGQTQTSAAQEQSLTLNPHSRNLNPYNVFSLNPSPHVIALQKARKESIATPNFNHSFPLSVPNSKFPFVPIPKSKKTEEELAALRERARAAAGYIPPANGVAVKQSQTRKRKATPRSKTKYGPYSRLSPGALAPSKKGGLQLNPHYRPPPKQHKNASAQSQQKWDDMFKCLVKFIEETRAKATKDLSDEEKTSWIWDGNVPTSYKTDCGKALGRWINNQRSAKAKGTLRDDRELRLVSTGLKWSVLTTNSWRDMLGELEIYVHEQTRNGQTWDGNVPTNYKIRSNISADGSEIDEEKNLGRWINRQRSLFQAGKLKKERQLDLERIGLKWSVLLTTSWSAMYESLCAYVAAKRKENTDGSWDGNVPANYKTDTNPPLSLGRWINRQRSAYVKGRLKEEFANKLEAIGLKWMIHERKRGQDQCDDDDDDFEEGEEFIKKEFAKKPVDFSESVDCNVDSGKVETVSQENVAKPNDSTKEVVATESVAKAVEPTQKKENPDLSKMKIIPI